MKTKIAIVIMVAVLLGIVVFDTVIAQPPIDPNEPIEPNQPRQIVMPKGSKLPTKYKCPRHGVIVNALLILDYEGVKVTYCKKCAIKFMIDVFDLNLPKLEIVNENT